MMKFLKAMFQTTTQVGTVELGETQRLIRHLPIMADDPPMLALAVNWDDPKKASNMAMAWFQGNQSTSTSEKPGWWFLTILKNIT